MPADPPSASRSGNASTGRLRPARFLVIFFFFLLVGFGLLFTPAVQSVDLRFSRVLVRISQALIVSCGGQAGIQGAALRSPAGVFAVEMQDGCNGVNVTILLCSAILAFPAKWRMKLLGVTAGCLIIQALNIVRFISLFYLGQYSMSLFDFAHGYLWETLLIFDTIFVFWVWASRFSHTGASNARD